MPKASILRPGQSYTFRNYFELSFEPEDILAEFGYSLLRSVLNLPQYSHELDRLASLKSRIEESLPYISLKARSRPPGGADCANLAGLGSLHSRSTQD